MVKPKIVYISNSTEFGTIYNKKELENISKICKSNGLFLYIDGARLGSALVAEKCDYAIDFLAKVADVFTIGGTKNGALFGEAIVINNTTLHENFRYNLKQRGALLSNFF